MDDSFRGQGFELRSWNDSTCKIVTEIKKLRVDFILVGQVFVFSQFFLNSNFLPWKSIMYVGTFIWKIIMFKKSVWNVNMLPIYG